MLRRHIIIWNILFLFLCGCEKHIIIYNTGKKDYTNQFKNAIKTSDYIIIKPGTYSLTAPVCLHSNLVIEGEGKVTLIKGKRYSHIFYNKNAVYDYTDVPNSSIHIKNHYHPTKI